MQNPIKPCGKQKYELSFNEDRFLRSNQIQINQPADEYIYDNFEERLFSKLLKLNNIPRTDIAAIKKIKQKMKKNADKVVGKIVEYYMKICPESITVENMPNEYLIELQKIYRKNSTMFKKISNQLPNSIKS